MRPRPGTLGLLVAGLLLAATAGAHAQTYSPQSSSPLSVTFQTERIGGSRVLLWGDVRNSSGNAAERVVLVAEGLDETGRVVSQGRGYVTGLLQGRSSSFFEIRLLASGSEKRYRVWVESFQFTSSGN